jgi:hypothetical protein
LVEKYKEQNVKVIVQNSTTLGISFINASFNNLDQAEREQKAQEIALFAKDHYPAINEIRRMWIAFVVSQSYYYVFQDNEVKDIFYFDKEGRAPDTISPEGAVTELRATSTYYKGENKTEVFVNHLQLYGTVNRGLILIPSFMTPGNQVRAPEWIDLEFASYSDRKQFVVNRKLSLEADGKLIFSGDARPVSSGETADGGVSEFLSQHISYGQFLQLINGTQVHGRLGEKDFTLTDEQLAALREMKQCIDNAKCSRQK